MKATLIDHMGTDLSVVNAARVSFDKRASEYSDEKNERLIRYLAKHNHKTPFGHCFASFHVKAPIFVARQLMRHQYLRINEISRRYVDTEPEFYIPDKWRGRADDKKQGSSDTPVDWWTMDSNLPAQYMESLVDLYERMLDEGVAPEQARMVLPQSTYTEWYWSGSLDAFANMYNLRIDPHSQKETQLVAQQIGGHLAKLYPTSWEALTNAG